MGVEMRVSRAHPARPVGHMRNLQGPENVVQALRILVLELAGKFSFQAFRLPSAR